MLINLVLHMIHSEKGCGSMVLSEKKFIEYCATKCDESNDTQKIINLLGMLIE